MKRFMPEKDRLLVELEPVAEKVVAQGIREDGEEFKIFSPELHKEKIRQGILLAVGKPAIPEDADRFSVGDTIMINFYVGKILIDYELGWLDDCHRVLRYDEVLGKLIG